jgi:hypothetical protein
MYGVVPKFALFMSSLTCLTWFSLYTVDSRYFFEQTGRIHAVEVAPNSTQISAEKTNHGSNFGQLGRYSTKLVAEIQLRAFDRS